MSRTEVTHSPHEIITRFCQLRKTKWLSLFKLNESFARSNSTKEVLSNIVKEPTQLNQKLQFILNQNYGNFHWVWQLLHKLLYSPILPWFTFKQRSQIIETIWKGVFSHTQKTPFLPQVSPQPSFAREFQNSLKNFKRIKPTQVKKNLSYLESIFLQKFNYRYLYISQHYQSSI